MRRCRTPSTCTNALGVEVRAAQVAVGEDRAGQQDRDRRRRAGRTTPSSGTPVVHAAAARLGHAVRGDDRDAGRAGARSAGPARAAAPPSSTASNERSASVAAASSRSRTSWVGTSEVYRGPAVGHRADRRGEGRRPERAGGPATVGDGARQHRADEHLEARRRGRVGSASSQCPGPASRSCVARRRRAQGGGRQQHAAGLARGARGPDDDGDVVAHRRRRPGRPGCDRRSGARQGRLERREEQVRPRGDVTQGSDHPLSVGPSRRVPARAAHASRRRVSRGSHPKEHRAVCPHRPVRPPATRSRSSRSRPAPPSSSARAAGRRPTRRPWRR